MLGQRVIGIRLFGVGFCALSCWLISCGGDGGSGGVDSDGDAADIAADDDVPSSDDGPGAVDQAGRIRMLQRER